MLSFIGESLQASSWDLLLWMLWHLPFEKDEGKLGQTLPLGRGSFQAPIHGPRHIKQPAEFMGLTGSTAV
jgi:hypothetical protein